MNDFISREAAKAVLENRYRIRTHLHDMAAAQQLKIAEWEIADLPAADVRPVVRGRWEYNPGDNIPYCSECMMPQDSECNFCPNCGADMREES